eukprot:scaffold3960_cov148-Amphora_coffeaeformis.AAC.1
MDTSISTTTSATATAGTGAAAETGNENNQDSGIDGARTTTTDPDVSTTTAASPATVKEDDDSSTPTTTTTIRNNTKESLPAQAASAEPVEVLSKNQQKKRRRLERMLEVKKRRKQQEKEAKAERAAAQGRNVQAERDQQAKNEASGEGKRRREELWNRRLQLAADNFGVCLDCAFEADMTDKEITSLALQVRYCYATNRRSDVPTLLAATSVAGQTRHHLENVAGFDEWQTRAFTCTAQPLEEYYGEDRKADLVYLTSDSENVLEDLDKTKIYIIGGIVDRNRLKRAAITRAQQLHIATAKLPLDEHLKKMESTRVLTCNHVFDILMHYSQHKSWEQALVSVLPPRKGAQLAAASHETKPPDNQPDTTEPKAAEDAEGQGKESS